MEILNKDDIKKLLNLKSSELIRTSISDRQLEVIRKGFNFLNQPENNALYIADEVGLGKTYIALGIASLLRHFSTNVESYQDVILVPKENLQNKWAKEIRQFITNNYLCLDNRVKSVIGNSVGSIEINETINSISKDIPSYHLFRNSSFSLGLSYNSINSLRNSLDEKIVSDREKDFLKRAESLGYFYASKKSLLKKFYAYLLGIQNPEIEILIVDEGHNFKQGLGLSDADEVSDRNNVTTRFFGLKRNSEEDKIIFQDFSEFRSLVKPKVKKLLVLSATPKTNSLIELKNQFDCFLPKHILSDTKSDNDIKAKLNHFLIRGKMEYELNEKIFSRNQCRYEHRKGNVEKNEDAVGLSIPDNDQALVLGLLQYNTIKHLNVKNNATFELGMLAGFETFKIDNEKKVNAEQEFEEVRTRKVQHAQDKSILDKIINSYKDEFGTLPPHPKQDAMVDAVFKLMNKGEKSLVFVRRVASAYELERRLLDKWEKEVIFKQLKQIEQGALNSKELKLLIQAYENHINNRLLDEHIDTIFKNLSKKLNKSRDFVLLNDQNELFPEEHLKIALYHVYHNFKELENGEQFYDYTVKQMHLEKFKKEYLQCAYDLVLKTKSQWLQSIKDDADSEFENDEDETYFFHNYFRQPAVKNFRKSRIYKTDWFDLNYYLLNEYYQIADFIGEPLKKNEIKTRDNDAVDIKEVQETFLKYVREENYKQHEINLDEYPVSLVSKRTLITELLLTVFEKEFNNFLTRLKEMGKRKSEIFSEIKFLVTIIRSTIRNGIGFLPLYIADTASGDFIKNYISLISEKESCFYDVIKEIKLIIDDLSLLQSVNFPNKNIHREIEGKLTFQSPVKGMSGIKKNKEKIATQFRMPGFPYVLITTDIFREGEDLHTYCQNIFHYGIAWNCSDMEQRTGRIDRINSMSNRKMMVTQKNDFDERLHVFYPYLEKTLEVNQVNKLFKSINEFTKAFDIVGVVEEDGIASVSTAVEEMPEKADVYMRSKFDHHSFVGIDDIGMPLKIMPLFGTQKNEIHDCLFKICNELKKEGKFHLEPQVNLDDFRIIGDYNLVNRKNRRGPFRILIKNSIYPGKFIIELSSYLFRINNRLQKLFKEQRDSSSQLYDIISIDDFYAFSIDINLNDVNYVELQSSLIKLVEVADEWEEKMTNNDETVFG